MQINADILFEESNQRSCKQPDSWAHWSEIDIITYIVWYTSLTKVKIYWPNIFKYD